MLDDICCVKILHREPKHDKTNRFSALVNEIKGKSVVFQHSLKESFTQGPCTAESLKESYILDVLYRLPYRFSCVVGSLKNESVQES